MRPEVDGIAILEKQDRNPSYSSGPVTEFLNFVQCDAPALPDITGMQSWRALRLAGKFPIQARGLACQIGAATANSVNTDVGLTKRNTDGIEDFADDSVEG